MKSYDRIVVVVPNSVTASPFAIIRAINAMGINLDRALFLVEEMRGGPIVSSLKESGSIASSVMDLDAESVPSASSEPVKNYELCVDFGMRDRTLRRLPIVGNTLPGDTDALWQDRLVWCTSTIDPARGIKSLDWDQVQRVDIVGGASDVSCLAEIVVAESGSRGIPVHGRVIGPVVGRLAPLWIAGCKFLCVDGEREAQSLRKVCPDRHVTKAHVALAKLGRNLATDLLDPTPVIIDVGHASVRSAVYNSIRRFSVANALSFPSIVIVGHPVTLELFRFHIADRVGCVSVHYEAGDPVVVAKGCGYPVLSCEPWRGVFYRDYIAGLDFGVLADSWQLDYEGLPDWVDEWVVGDAGGDR